MRRHLSVQLTVGVLPSGLLDADGSLANSSSQLRMSCTNQQAFLSPGKAVRGSLPRCASSDTASGVLHRSAASSVRLITARGSIWANDTRKSCSECFVMFLTVSKYFWMQTRILGESGRGYRYGTGKKI